MSTQTESDKLRVKVQNMKRHLLKLFEESNWSENGIEIKVDRQLGAPYEKTIRIIPCPIDYNKPMTCENDVSHYYYKGSCYPFIGAITIDMLAMQIVNRNQLLSVMYNSLKRLAKTRRHLADPNNKMPLRDWERLSWSYSRQTEEMYGFYDKIEMPPYVAAQRRWEDESL